MSADEQPGYSGPPHLAKYAFKPGVSGNPNGRPRGRLSLLGILEDKLANLTVPGTGLNGMPDKAIAEVLVERTILDALNGDSRSRQLVWEYLEGKPTNIVPVQDVEEIVRIVDDV